MNRPEIGISRRYLHDEVVERIRALILDGDLEPRARVNELELCERFGISRGIVERARSVVPEQSKHFDALVKQLGFGIDNAFGLLTRRGVAFDTVTHPATRRRLAQLRMLDTQLAHPHLAEPVQTEARARQP